MLKNLIIAILCVGIILMASVAFSASIDFGGKESKLSDTLDLSTKPLKEDTYMETTGAVEIQELAKHWEVLITVIIVGLVQVVKQAIPSVPTRVIPLVNLSLGVGFMLALAGLTLESAIAGMLIGFAASGLWSSGKTMTTN